ncbi:MAG: 7-carboxy-7-deazaguanine synthase QueE [Gammaproteobacteria bacterium]
MSTRLRITEIFYSLQGETTFVGLPTVFVRLTGCPLRCQYCDTEYAFSGGHWYEQADIVKQIQLHKTPYVTVTGGEPLAQKNCISLLTQLCELNFKVSLETSGAIDVSQVDPRVIKIIDIKTPGSKEVQRNCYNNLKYLQPHDQIKFVLCDRNDFMWASQVIYDLDLVNHYEILFSPSAEQLAATQLAEWILEQRLPVRMQIQLHKYLWGNIPGK